MTTDRATRKLTVILHADVMGSTALVQRDETLAHERIQNAFRRFSETIRAYGGTPQEVRGDALLATFDRASDAASAALSFQTGNAHHNETLADEIRPELRIGIAIGEVVIADSTLTGPDVVTAQRIEQLAEPGGICIQGTAYETIPRRLLFEYTNLGERQLKGFDDPVRVYALKSKLGEEIPGPDPQQPIKRFSGRRTLVGALAVALVIVGVVTAWLKPWHSEVKRADPAKVANALPAKPSVAVLPFENLSADEEQEYFSDGLTGDIITDLARVSGLLVIARNSAFVYKGRPVDVTEVGRKLGVRYVVEGSVRRSGDRLRITAQLVDAISGMHIWANRYDREMADVFVLQDEVTRTIVDALSVQLTDEEERAISTVPVAKADAYDLLLRGNEFLSQFTPEGFDRARAFYRQALQLSPRYARAHANIAFTYAQEAQFGPTNELEETIQLGFAAAERAKQLDEQLPQLHLALGSLLGAEQRWQAAAAAARRSIELEPSYADGYALLSVSLTFVGDLEAAHTAIERAKRLNPHYSFPYLWVEGRIYYLSRRYGQAVTSLEAVMDRNPDFEQGRVELAAAYAQLGRTDEATWEAEQVLLSNPDFRISENAVARGFVDEELKTIYVDGLRRAGFPE